MPQKLTLNYKQQTFWKLDSPADLWAELRVCRNSRAPEAPAGTVPVHEGDDAQIDQSASAECARQHEAAQQPGPVLCHWKCGGGKERTVAAGCRGAHRLSERSLIRGAGLPLLPPLPGYCSKEKVRAGANCTDCTHSRPSDIRRGK